VYINVLLKIDCDDCQFSSPLTDTILLTTSIVFLTPQNTDDNSLSGSIPTEIGSLTSLTELFFGKCRAIAFP
jgi:hypothetical protein